MKQLYLLPILLFLFLSSCKEEGDTPSPDINETEAPCMVLEENRSSRSGLNNRTANVEYDAGGRIASVTYKNGNGAELVDRYERNSAGKISKIQTFNGANVTWQMDVEYNPKGDLIRGTTPADGGTVIQIEYEYDPQGNITKTTRTVENRGRTETRVKTYEYINGNLTRVVVKHGTSGNSVEHYVYEYYLDKPAFPLEFDNVFFVTLDRGTPSKNLLKRYTVTHPSDEDYKQVGDLTYKLNEAGMPTRTTRTFVVYDGGAIYDHAPDSLVTTRSYKCE